MDGIVVDDHIKPGIPRNRLAGITTNAPVTRAGAPARLCFSLGPGGITGIGVPVGIQADPTCGSSWNPEEGCHGEVAQHLWHAAPTNTREMLAPGDRGFARIRQHPNLILGGCRHAGLHVNQLW
jgi:hypothetical protein